MTLPTLPDWTHDWGRLFGGLTLTLLMLLWIPPGYTWLPAFVIGLVAEGYWTGRHEGITLDCIFDFLLMLYGLSLSRFLVGDIAFGGSSLVVLIGLTLLLWDHRIPRPHDPHYPLRAEYLWGLQWGVDTT